MIQGTGFRKTLPGVGVSVDAVDLSHGECMDLILHFPRTAVRIVGWSWNMFIIWIIEISNSK